MPAPFDPASLPDDPKLLREMLLLLMGQLKEKDERIEKLTFWVKEFRQRQLNQRQNDLRRSQLWLRREVRPRDARRPRRTAD